MNGLPPMPLFKRKSYKVTSGILFVVALIFFAFNRTAAVFMLLAVLLSLGGSYSTRNRVTKSASHAAGSLARLIGQGGPSLAVLGTSGPAVIIYALSFLAGISNISTPTATSTTVDYGGSFGN